MDIIFREERLISVAVAQSGSTIKKRAGLGGFWSSLFFTEKITRLSEVISTLAIKIGLTGMQQSQLHKLLKNMIEFIPKRDLDTLQEQDVLNFLYLDMFEVQRVRFGGDLAITQRRLLRKVLNSLAKWLAKLTKSQQHRIEWLQQRAFHLSMG